MTAIENIAWIIVIVSVIKLIILLINPGAWMNFAKKLYSKPGQLKVITLVLAIIVFYYLIQEITIIQIFATMAFLALVIVIGLASDIAPLIKKYDALIKSGNLWKQFWLYTLIWAILLIWAIKDLVM